MVLLLLPLLLLLLLVPLRRYSCGGQLSVSSDWMTPFALSWLSLRLFTKRR